MTTSIAYATNGIDYEELLRLCEWQANHAAFACGYAIPKDDFLDGAHEGMTRALERTTGDVHAPGGYVAQFIRGRVSVVPRNRAIRLRREQAWAKDVYHDAPLIEADTETQLTWLDSQLTLHHACFPAHCHQIYRAVREGHAIGRDLARAWGIHDTALHERYNYLVRIARRHLVRQATSCTYEQQATRRATTMVQNVRHRTPPHTPKGVTMPTTTRPSRQALAEDIAAAKAKLRQLEQQLKREEKEERDARCLAIGDVVMRCGLFDADLSELELVLKYGLRERDARVE